MLKRNLIIIAIAILAMGLSSNVFGQEKNRKTKVRKSSNATVSGGIYPSKTKASNSSAVNGAPNTNRKQFNPKELSVDKVKNTRQTNGYIGETEKNVTKTKTRSRQTNQAKTNTTTKPLIVIPTDYPNVKTKKPGNFIGSGDDGQSMKQKPNNNRRTYKPKNTVPTNQAPKPKTKRKIKPFIGGSDDGQSI